MDALPTRRERPNAGSAEDKGSTKEEEGGEYRSCLFLLPSRCGALRCKYNKGENGNGNGTKLSVNMTSVTDFSRCSAMILIQLLAAVKEMRCQKQKRCKPEQKIITSRNVLQIIPLKIQLHCSSSLLTPQIFLFPNHSVETHLSGMKLRT